MRRLAPAAALLAAALLATGPAAAEILWSHQGQDEATCGAWEALDMSGRIDGLKAVEPYGDFLEAADRGAAEAWANEVAAECAGHPDRLLGEAARAAAAPGG